MLATWHQCSIIRYFKTKNLKKFWGGTQRHCPSPPLPIPHRRMRCLDPHAFGTCPCPKILDPPLAPATVLAAASTSALSLVRRLEVAPVTVTCAVCSSSGCCLGRLPAMGPQSSQTDSKSMALPIVELAEMEGGQSVKGLLIIDSSCTVQSSSRRLACSLVSHFT